MSDCPDPSTLDRYLARALPEDAREGIERHLADCAMCRRVLALGLPTSRSATDSDPDRDLDRRTLLGERFDLQERLGTGAFGTVYQAIDRNLDRLVALKFVPATEPSAARVLREGQALARLDHPNVVKVYEVTETPDAAVVVMELVVGRPLGQGSGSTVPTPRALVAQFVQVARGLAAIHSAGLVHRDIKPDNIVVGDDGRPRIVDFGLARSLGPAEGASRPSLAATGTSRTLHGGTPAYMAPECLAGADATPLSDEFSLCVTFFEALHRTRPFHGSSVTELLHRIRAAEIVRVAGQTRLPAWLDRVLRRGLAAVPSDRFPSVAELATALERGLHRRRRIIKAVSTVVPLLAVGSTAWAVARHDGAEVSCADAAGRIVTTWTDERQTAVREAMMATGVPYAEPAWRTVSTSIDRFVAAWIATHTETCEATLVRAEQTAATMDVRFACLRQAELELAATIEVLASADPKTVQKAHELVSDLRSPARCGQMQPDLVDPPNEAARETIDQVRASLATAGAEYRSGRLERARQSVAEAQRLAASLDDDAVRSELALMDGLVAFAAGEYDASERALRGALEAATRAHRWDEAWQAAVRLMMVVGDRMQRPAEAMRYWEVAIGLAGRDPIREARTRSVRGVLLFGEGKFAEAEAAHRTALSLLESRVEPNDLAIARAREGLALALSRQDRNAEARVELEAVLAIHLVTLGEAHPTIGSLQLNLASITGQLGELAAAEAMTRRTLAIQEPLLGASHLMVTTLKVNLAMWLRDRGAHDEAKALLLEALAGQRVAQGDDHPAVAETKTTLASVLLAAGELREAEAVIREALAVLEATLGPEHPDTSIALGRLATILDAAGRPTEAIDISRRVLTSRETSLGPDHRLVAAAHQDLGHRLGNLGPSPEAETHLRRAVEIFGRAVPSDHPDLAKARCALGQLLLTRKQPREAIELGEAAWQRLQRADVAPEQRAESALLLARALLAGDRSSTTHARARRLASAAIDDYGIAGQRFAKPRAEARAFLGKL